MNETRDVPMRGYWLKSPKKTLIVEREGEQAKDVGAIGEAGGDGHELHSQSLRWILVGVEQRLSTLSPPRRASARHPPLQ